MRDLSRFDANRPSIMEYVIILAILALVTLVAALLLGTVVPTISRAVFGV